MIVATGRILPSLESLPVLPETLRITFDPPPPPPVVNPIFPAPSVASTWPFAPSEVGNMSPERSNCDKVVIPTDFKLLIFKSLDTFSCLIIVAEEPAETVCLTLFNEV